MRKIYILLTLIPLLGFSQKKSFWTKANTNRVEQKQLVERATSISKYTIYNLNIEGLKTELSKAVSRNSNEISNTFINIPNAKGEMERYEVYNASIMEPEFAARHPEIQSYIGKNLDKPGVTMRFSTTVFGFHAAIYNLGETLYIDPYSKDLNSYVLYSRKDLKNEVDRLGCELSDELDIHIDRQTLESASTQRNANDGLLRTFRFALASTQEYSNFHIDAAGQQAASDAVKRSTVLAAMNVSMTRVSGLYERDLSVTFQLVDNINTSSGTSIIFLEEDDGYTNNSGSTMLGQNQTIIDANIGTANYDVGHVFSTGGGGVASLGGICFVNAKARAVTGLSAPVGDVFDIDFVSHEVGHHFGANHSYNGGQGSCGPQRNQSTAVEPGSGNTIMGYAGICSGDNVQPNSDDHFHAVSIDEMYARITSSPTCSVNTANGNTAPTADAGNDYTIPYGTAFTLTGSGSDADAGAMLTYNWEQVDTGTSTDQPNTTSTDNPQFRSRPSTTSPERTFPQLSDILSGNLTPQWEVIPNVARTMNFALTVRDNQMPGQTNRSDMVVTVANTGPFRVTAPDMTNQAFPAGSSTTVTWDVAGTRTSDGNGINTDNVNILLSTDGGLNFNTVLASSTPNDGSQSITFPSGLQEGQCRIKIEAVNNIFFTISKSFSIGVEITTMCNTYSTGPISTPIPDSTGSNVQGTPVFIPVSVSESTPITDLRVSVDVTHGYIGDLIIQLQPAAGGFSNIWARTCNSARFENIDVTFIDGQPAITCATPTQGTYAPANSMAAFNGTNPQGTWNLVFVDFFNGDSGVVNEWSIELCSTTETVLNNNNFELDDFSFYPNPNDGTFNLKFNSNSGRDIAVSVYDISGKRIYNKNYDARPAFDEQITLSTIASGIYIMKVDDGEKSISKKLIIE